MFRDKGSHIYPTAIYYVPGTRCSFPNTCYALIFSEVGLYSLYGNKVIVVFELNKRIVASQYLFPRKTDDSSLASQAV